ncbi:MAG: DUF1810 domain-containing protein [Desulforudis sp.]|jgi:uncharacterized protein (DUF1810 family)|nr:MAG: DUF1810 domain-containing protein [Desulforudis sp.]
MKKKLDDHQDPYNLKRFLCAQEGIYSQVVVELRSGRKLSHWMWYIFPQIEGLGFSEISMRFGIKSVEEARQYLNHPVLGSRLKECTETVMDLEGRSATDILGYPDDVKLRSSMTLFAYVSDDPDNVFVDVLNKYFNGFRDIRTIRLIAGK